MRRKERSLDVFAAKQLYLVMVCSLARATCLRESLNYVDHLCIYYIDH